MAMDSAISIRPMQKGEIPKIYEIERKSFDYPFSESIIHFFYDACPELCFSIYYNHNLAGFLLGGKTNTKSQVHILSIAIAKEYRRRKLGETLMKFFIEYCKKAGYQSIKLEVKINNMAAIKLYRKLGFNIVRKIRKYYEDNTDAYEMLLSLD